MGLHRMLLRICVCLGCQTVCRQLWEVVINQHTLALGTVDESQVGLKLSLTVLCLQEPLQNLSLTLLLAEGPQGEKR